MKWHYWFSPEMSPSFVDCIYLNIEHWKSQNHMGWKGPIDIIKSNPLVKRVPYCRWHRTVCWWVLNISREGDITASMGSLSQCCPPQNKGVLPCVWTELPVFQCVPIAPCPIVAHLQNVCPHQLDSCTLDTYKQWGDPLSALSSPDWSIPGLLAFPHLGDAAGP